MILTTKQILAMARLLEERGYDKDSSAVGRSVLVGQGGDGWVAWLAVDDPEYKAEHLAIDRTGVLLAPKFLKLKQ